MNNLLGFFSCFVSLMLNVYGQTPKNQDFSIKVGVEEVRIDATVLDRKGRQVTDLTAADFELYQDGKLQKIVSCVYINDSLPSASPGASLSDQLISKPMLPRDRVRRTIVFVVDDFTMSFENFHYSRMALQKYIESQMEPGDIIAILQTSAGIGAMQQFSSDRRHLLSSINSMHWGGFTAYELHGARALAFGILPSVRDGFAVDAGQSLQDKERSSGRIPSLFDLAAAEEQIREGAASQYQIGTIAFGLRALRDMPGRKHLIFLSPQITYPSRGDNDRLFNELADKALRAGAVIHMMDMRGVTVWTRLETQRYMPLAKKTGGIKVENSNFFLHGIKPAEEAMKGYYLLSYVPPADSFGKNSGSQYHKIGIKAKRKGIEIHSRDGFYGISTDASRESNSTETLRDIVYSPFLYNDLELSLSSGYAHAPANGYFLRSWLHLDGKNLVFSDENNGEHSLSLELAIMTSNAAGVVQDFKNLRHGFNVKDEEIPRIRREGIDLNTFMLIEKPGDYYVRAAIKDRASGKIGSGYQFLSVPDLKKNQLSLSSIFVLNHGEDLSSIRSGSSSSEALPGFRKSPALRTYLPGEGFDYIAVVYNAKSQRNQPPELVFLFTLSKDGQPFYQSKPEKIDINQADDLGRIPIVRRVAFGKNMDEGFYVFQLVVRDKQVKGKSGSAFQAIDFEIRKE